MITRQHYDWSDGMTKIDEDDEQPRQGKVYLIGAGPGDSELITLKGLRYLRSADVVLYDRLINTELLEETRKGAVHIFVGKGPKQHTMDQESINTLLITYARQGCKVVRLKGGDPCIFGRGGEEAEALVKADIPFEIVPGVTSAIAVPAYAGIPVTHREHASAVTIITGHESTSLTSRQMDWEAVARIGGTLVILMSVKTLPEFTQRLIAGGLDPELPAAVIQNGTTERQRVITGTLATIAEDAATAGLTAPATTVIGHVVNLRETLAWYQTEQCINTTE
ncbi:MAG TPA: uroporphyrinogen-III C-methyltransferase [Ktedonobacteraceae bacterium]